ncbi:sensor domain-containing diguanylate cyclase [Thalassotalea ganghwensis]
MRLLSICLLWLCCAYSLSAQTYGIEVKSPTLLKSAVYQLDNPDKRSFSANQVVNLDTRYWSKYAAKPFALTQQAHWMMIEVSNQQSTSANFYLLFNNALKLRDIQIYQPSLDDIIQVSPVTRFYDRFSSGELAIAARTTIKIYVQVTNLSANTIDIQVLDAQQYVKSLANNHYQSGLAIGGMLTLAFTALALFIANGSKTVLFLFGYFLTISFVICVQLGLTLYRLFPNFPELKGVELPILAVASVIFIFGFTRQLFNLRKQLLLADNWLKYSSWLAFTYLPVSMLLSMTTNLHVSHLLSLYAFGCLAVIGSLLIYRKLRLATLYTLVMGVQFLVHAVLWLSHFGVGIDIEFYILSFGLHGFLILFILSRQYYYQQLDTKRMQAESLESELTSRRAQQELIELQKETQEQLEARVQERTLELNIALQELEEANRELAEKNTLDELTGLFNRRHYDQKIVAEFRRSRRNLTPLSIIVIDIDHFKQVNDTYGHIAGDNCLVALARLIKMSLRRSTDIGCRYGGEEFCLLLPETDEAGASALAEELRTTVEKQTYSVENQEISFTISCGISTYQQQQDVTPELLFSAADKALYQAKRSGRNQVKVYDINTLLAEQELTS